MTPSPRPHEGPTVRPHGSAFTMALGVSAAATVVGSLLFQADYAQRYGWPGPSAYLFPLSVDALGVAAWLAANARAGWGPKLCGALAVLVSMVANTAGHALSGDGLSWGVFLSGAWPPVAMALVVYLWFQATPAPAAWAEVADPTPTPVPAAPPAAVTGPLDAAPGSAQASGSAAPTSEPVSRDAGSGTPDVVGAADSPEPVEPTPAAVALTEAALAPTARSSPYGTASRDECLAAAKSLGDVELVRHARDHRIPTTVLGLREAYAVSHSRARALNQLAKPPAPSAADQGPAAAGVGAGVRS
jgi:hypothetical protein